MTSARSLDRAGAHSETAAQESTIVGAVGAASFWVTRFWAVDFFPFPMFAISEYVGGVGFAIVVCAAPLYASPAGFTLVVAQLGVDAMLTPGMIVFTVMLGFCPWSAL